MDRIRIDLAHEPEMRLGTLRVRPPQRELIRVDGAREVIEPRVMQVLVALAKSDGVMTRDELVARCWGGRIVGDDAIHRVVSRLRRVAEWSGAFRIETLTKVGYRIAVGDGDGEDAGDRADSFGGSAAAGRSLDRRRLLIGGGVLAAGVAGAAWWRHASRARDGEVALLLARSAEAMRLAMPDSNAQGIGFLEEAARIAPDRVDVWGRLALARSIAAQYAPPEQGAAATAGVQRAADQARALDPRQADAAAALALLVPVYGEWAAAERRLRDVLAIDPGHLATLGALSFLHVAAGLARLGSRDRVRFAARESLDAAQQYNLVYAYWILGDVARADQTADRALRLWPRHPGAWFARLWTLAFTARADRALAHIEEAAMRPAADTKLFDALHIAVSAIASRRQPDAARAADALVALVAQGPSNSVNAIMLLAALGKIDEAFAVAEAFLLERGPLMAAVNWRAGTTSVNDQHHRKTNQLFVPVTAPMRRDPRFLPLTEAIGLARYWREGKVTPDFLRDQP